MKKLFLSFLMCSSIVLALASQNSYVAKADNIVDAKTKSACLMDFNSGEVVYNINGDTRRPIASMTKIMTLNLIFDEIASGRLNYDDLLTVSQRASGMGGSQVFLDDGGKYHVKDLIKSIVVSSANDASVVFAEHIGGSVEGFVDLMNDKAKVLGMTNTNFANPTGLPNVNGYSCAIDVAKMTRELLSHSDYFNFSKIWMDEIVHNDGRVTSMSNTNKLLRRNIGVDGGKTGFTAEAMHCISATAKKDSLRLISVVVGACDSKTRFDDCAKMLEYGFGNYQNVALLQKDKPILEQATVLRGKVKSVQAVAEEDYFAFTKKRVVPTENVEIVFDEKLKAPIKKGDVIGEAIVFKDGVETARVKLLANEDVDRRGLFEKIK